MEEKPREQENTEYEDIKLALKTRGYKYDLMLGKGSNGVVVQAEHPVDKLKYAIKILPFVDDENAKYSKRELDALTTSDLYKQNIVKYYSCWQAPVGDVPSLFIQMELCRVSLEAFVYSNEMGNAKIISAQGPPRFYRHVFGQILNGLRAMHELNLVHRDIHISNILIANPKPTNISQINIKIADFGLAREIGSVINASPSLTDAPKLQKLSPGVGNELFRAPELATEYYDCKVDMYSAGVVLYFLSRYLEDKQQWRSEILALRNGERGVKDLCHQDDAILLRLIPSLMQEDPKERPSAEEALNHWKNTKSENPIQSKVTAIEKKEKRFYIKKDGQDSLKRGLTKDDTLQSLQEEIENCTGIKAESQVIQQETVINNKEEVFEITSDQDVRCMFQSAEEGRKKVIVSVSDTSEMEVDYVDPEEV